MLNVEEMKRIRREALKDSRKVIIESDAQTSRAAMKLVINYVNNFMTEDFKTEGYESYMSGDDSYKESYGVDMDELIDFDTSIDDILNLIKDQVNSYIDLTIGKVFNGLTTHWGVEIKSLRDRYICIVVNIIWEL